MIIERSKTRSSRLCLPFHLTKNIETSQLPFNFVIVLLYDVMVFEILLFILKGNDI